MKLNVHERLLLLNFLPKEGNFEDVRCLKELSKEIGFSPEEEERFSLKKDEKINQFTWDVKKEEEKEVKFTDNAFKLVEKVLKKLDEQNKLQVQFISVYEKFVKG